MEDIHYIICALWAFQRVWSSMEIMGLKSEIIQLGVDVAEFQIAMTPVHLNFNSLHCV